MAAWVSVFGLVKGKNQCCFHLYSRCVGSLRFIN
uniref:Uncharacterized protein n=1 Tax=Rhizophora mucronata TaxID=61149 RepID=A0A2P2MG18_RHIMU